MSPVKYELGFDIPEDGILRFLSFPLQRIISHTRKFSLNHTSFFIKLLLYSSFTELQTTPGATTHY
jgi:hypothetical protein